MELIFLGTGCAIPTQRRNLPAIVLKRERFQILIDCGEDVQRRFEQASLKFNAPLVILISHMHGDHIIGLPGLLFHFSLSNRTKPISIYGPPGIFFYLMSQKYSIGLNPPFLKEVFEFDGEDNSIMRKYDFKGRLDQQPEILSIEDDIIFENDEINIKKIPVLHSVPTWGFRLDEKPRAGKFNPEIALKLGINNKKVWKELQLGHSITYEGRLIEPFKEKIIGPPRQGISVGYSADTKICPGLELISKDCDFLICESTFSNALIDQAEAKKHLTAEQAARIALKNNVKTLILTHISSRFSSQEDFDTLLEEAKSIFQNTIIAEDMLRLDLKKEQTREK